MSAPENINNVLKDILTRFNTSAPFDTGKKNNEPKSSAIGINPSQALVIGALLAGVLEVTSVLVDRDQTVQIVLTGTLKKKSELENLLDQIGSKSFDEVIKALLGRF